MKTIRTAKLNNGEKVWLEEEEYGWWIFFEDDEGNFDETTGQAVPKNVFDRDYTHGSSLYREACQKLDVL